jgi:Uma2 family endonuclease
MPAAPRHGHLLSRIVHQLFAHVDTSGGGRVYVDCGFVLPLSHDPEQLRAPDVSFVSDATLERAGGEPESGWAHYAPDLAVEVVSPTNTAAELQQKVTAYLDAGVRLTWLVDPDTRSVTVYRADGTGRLVRRNEALVGEDVLPGLSLPLERIFG